MSHTDVVQTISIGFLVVSHLITWVYIIIKEYEDET